MENAIRVERLSERFGAVVARGPLDFDVGVGEVLGHLGPNGGQDHDDSAAAWHAGSYPWQGHDLRPGCDTVAAPTAGAHVAGGTSRWPSLT